MFLASNGLVTTDLIPSPLKCKDVPPIDKQKNYLNAVAQKSLISKWEYLHYRCDPVWENWSYHLFKSTPVLSI